MTLRELIQALFAGVVLLALLVLQALHSAWNWLLDLPVAYFAYALYGIAALAWLGMVIYVALHLVNFSKAIRGLPRLGISVEDDFGDWGYNLGRLLRRLFKRGE